MREKAAAYRELKRGLMQQLLTGKIKSKNMTTDKMKTDRIADALFLLSRENYWDAIKIVYDLLVNETFVHATTNKIHKQYELEEKGKETLCLMYDFLIDKNVVNVADVISEIRLLTIYFNNFSREALTSKVKNHKVKVLAMNLIGLLNFLEQNSSSNYFFGMIDSDLKNEIQNNITEEIYEKTTPYFEILLTSKKDFQKDFWEDLDNFDPEKIELSIFDEIEYEKLLEYKSIIDNHQLTLDKETRDKIEDIWGTFLNLEIILSKVKSQYHLMTMYSEFENFRKHDKSSGKYDKNVYKTEKEAVFHKNIYPFLCGRENYDLIISEFVTGNQRYDILLYDSKISLSAVVELKVNDLTEVDKNIDQILDYLDQVEDKPYHYMESPTLGVLLTYYIGNEKLSDIDIAKLTSKHSPITKISNNFYLLKPTEEHIMPVLIGVFNGKE